MIGRRKGKGPKDQHYSGEMAGLIGAADAFPSEEGVKALGKESQVFS